MDYQKAKQTRKKSLLTLIGEKKFEQGKGLGSSIGGAISDKFKAKAVGIKESMDPLNWLSSIVGQGGFGRMVTTGAGRAFGRSGEDIKYFGGYGGGKKKKGGKKDPQITSVSAGAVKPLQVGDSIADILGKMYNFMEKTHEIYKLNYEIETAFRQEQLDEDERRHKKLIESILGKKAKPEKDNGMESFIEKLLEGIKKTLSFIMKPVMMVLSLIKDIGLMVGSAVLGAMTSLTTFLIGSILSIITPAISYLAELSVKRALSGIANNIPAPFGTALKLGVAAWFGAQAEDLERKLLQNLMPEDVAKASEKGSGSDYDKARENYAKNISQYGVGTGSALAAKKNFDKEKEKLQEKLDQNFKENIEPIAKAAGYTVDYEPGPDGTRDTHLGLAGGLDLPVILNKEKEQVLPEGLALLTMGVKQSPGVLDVIKGDTEGLKKKFKLDKVQSEIENKIESTKTQIQKLFPSELDKPSIPPQLSEDEPIKKSLSSNEQIITQNSTNVIGGKSPGVVNVNGVKMRDSCTQDAVRKSTVPC